MSYNFTFITLFHRLLYLLRFITIESFVSKPALFPFFERLSLPFDANDIAIEIQLEKNNSLLLHRCIHSLRSKNLKKNVHPNTKFSVYVSFGWFVNFPRGK